MFQAQPQFSVSASELTELKLFLATAGSELSELNIIKTFNLGEESISCVLWNGIFHITGTDIVKIVTWRLEKFGRRITNQKKFEEGIFSDLRNLKAGDHATLEEPRSLFLDCLFKQKAIRTQKKQKVFYFYSVPHDSLFLEVIERDLKREASGLESTTTSIIHRSPLETIELAKGMCTTLPGTFPTTDFRTLPTYLNQIMNWKTSLLTDSLSLQTPQLSLNSQLQPSSSLMGSYLNTSPTTMMSSMLNPSPTTMFSSMLNPSPTATKKPVHKCEVSGCSRSFQSPLTLSRHMKKHQQNMVNMPFSPRPRGQIQTPLSSQSPFFTFNNDSLDALLFPQHSPHLFDSSTGITPLMTTLDFANFEFGSNDSIGMSIYDKRIENELNDLQELFRVNEPLNVPNLDMKDGAFDIDLQNQMNLFNSFLSFEDTPFV